MCIRDRPVVVPLLVRSALIGRVSASKHIVPDIDCTSDSGVSRRHAQLTTDGTRWFVEDLGLSLIHISPTLAQALVDFANAQGGIDNITVALARVGATSGPPESAPPASTQEPPPDAEPAPAAYPASEPVTASATPTPESAPPSLPAPAPAPALSLIHI